MGNYRFRLSDMMPNAWFYKLKNMSKTSPHNNNNSSPNPFKHKKMHPTPTTTISSSPSHHQTLQPRKSYYFTREQHTPSPLKQDYLPNSPINPKISDVPFPESPRKSTKRRSSRRRRRRNNIKSSSSSSATTTTTTTTKFVNSSVSAGCSCRATLESVWVTKSDSIPYYSSPFYSVSPPPHHQCSPGEFDSNRNEATTDISEGGGPASSWSSTTTTTTTTCSGRISSSTTDIIIEDVDSKKSSSSSSPTTEKFEKVYEFDTISEIELPPILTKPQKYMNKEKKETTQPMTKPPPPRRSSSNGGSSSLLSVKVSKKETMKSNNALKEQKISPMMNRRCSSTGSPGLKRRANSPKIFGSRKIQACSKKTTMSSGTTASSSSSSLMRSTRKKNLSDSFAIIKSSLDPQRDFKESMVEMIVENNLRASKDLEELLACYLSLNSNEYHDLIVDVFQQIWLELTDIRL